MSAADGREDGRVEVAGVAASLGIALGPVHVVPRGDRARRRRVRDRAAEVRRLREAIEASRAEIEAARDTLDEETALVLDAQLLMHRDELLVDAAVKAIEELGLDAEWAVERTVDELRQPLLRSDSFYFRERAEDVAHVGQHILRHLRGDLLRLPERPLVLVAADLSPAEAVRLLGDERVLGLVTESGSATSHTALLARALEVPAVVGVAGLLERIEGSPEAVVDGLAGKVVLTPSAEEAAAAAQRSERYRRFANQLRARAGDAVVSRDGEEVALAANIELPREAGAACAHGAAGIGLYRTEFLYLDRDAPPSEEEQRRVYQEVLDACPGRGVTIRTFDLGGDKLPRTARFDAGPNPALGLRALRLGLRRREVLRTQLRAVLRAAADREAALMFPMVSDVGELRRARALVREVEEALDREGLPRGSVRVGAMIEVPSAALLAGQLLAQADFLSVGTNDLVQYTLAVDRSNPDVAPLGDPAHPAVLQLLARVVEAGRVHGKPVAMCGDMAADPIALPVVLGLGFRRLSMPLGSLPFAQETVRRVAMSELAPLAEEALAMESGAEVRDRVREQLRDALGELWVEQGL
ncbi:MAG TPA: phosphoenolpyruvate--protein phosphotransferase [Polyangiaceae bacterium LLY-WYZ-15_(1-7)]|nr:phosphoenolpyruvate--protein phosphotransferase [Myxococcales bacterium]MBJ74350.1 phosphoenolpyruvate--protein phosphotransferase [Sandaracinus sp.]HJL05774.1 phosphoenolpyruvate--protein phosphotransferase [Polyangiaceae bacterium LLY-WYZ-15_(1-7)]HJL11617.1 phosphoenolpyruvate--protein phosphotransferase [Polyangiaceae bacterium LLY-WYZ-15_(1-7)]HJL23290.1 phosphoenolpyruvate--protein phosphotransferase [Polyangiaceae bacterium LLY-WYZ-15_(1-7)]